MSSSSIGEVPPTHGPWVSQEGFSGWAEPYEPEVPQMQASWGKGAYVGGQGPSCVFGKNTWGKKGGKKGHDKSI